MKAKEYFAKLKEQGKISLEDYDKFLETIPDTLEIPDTVAATLSDKFMTRDRAKTDSELRKVFHRELYDAVDAGIHESLPALDVFDAQDIQNEPDTFKKIKKIRAAIERKIEKVGKAPSAEESQKLKELKALNEELTAKFGAKDQEWQGKLEANNQKWQKDLNDFKIDHTLSEKILKYSLADEFDKDSVTRLIKLDLLNKNSLALGENGQIIVQEVVDGKAKPKFDGNDPVTIEKLLEAQVKPFLKKNNSDAGDTQQQQQQTQTRQINNNGNQPMRGAGRSVAAKTM